LRPLSLAPLLIAVWLIAAALPAAAQETPSFRLGFKLLADQIPNIVGTPIENEHSEANGDSLQQTSTGMMVWRKADNWTAFTNGSRTWINGPSGIQDRSNDDRFPWEAPTPATVPAPSAAPTYTGQDPSDADIVRGQAILSRSDGSRLYRCTLANINHYWSIDGITVTVILRDAAGKTILQDPAVGNATSVGPQQQATWEYPIPASVAYDSASAEVAFRWLAPGR
jgi:hypothetical protein